MLLEFDHLFVCTSIGAPEVDALVALGLTEGPPNTHPGQGTANRRIFFRNAMLEFLWVVDTAEVRSPRIAPTQLWQRWQYQQSGFSPFGIALRRADDQRASPAAWPFATWSYRPPYLPGDLDFRVASNTTAVEPWVVVIPFDRHQASLPAAQRHLLDHASGFRDLTAVTISLPQQAPLSPAVQTLHDAGVITCRRADEQLAVIEFDGGTQHQEVDLRPGLPLAVRW